MWLQITVGIRVGWLLHRLSACVLFHEGRWLSGQSDVVGFLAFISILPKPAVEKKLTNSYFPGLTTVIASRCGLFPSDFWHSQEPVVPATARGDNEGILSSDISCSPSGTTLKLYGLQKASKTLPRFWPFCLSLQDTAESFSGITTLCAGTQFSVGSVDIKKHREIILVLNSRTRVLLS